MFCNQCGIANPDDARFCSACGHQLQTAESPREAEVGTPSGDAYQTIGGRPTAAGPPSPASECVLECGSLFGGRYHVRRLLGRGGMGEVYEAADNVLNDTVALKVLRPDLRENAVAVERFTREARISLRLAHKNIIRVHDILLVDGLRCIAMEYIDGANLRQLLQKRWNADKSFAVKQVVTLGAVVCDAMHYAHQVTIHRDLKPENILITRAKQIKVSDFGIAQLLTGTQFQVTNATLGTAYYMAPEQSTGRGTLDHRADVYSLGVILYEALVGQLPIGRFRSVGELRSDVPEHVNAVIMSALETDADRRPQTMKVFRQQILGPAKSPSSGGRQASGAERAAAPAAATATGCDGKPTERDPAKAKEFLGKAKAAEAGKRYLDAIEHLDKSLEMDPNLAEAWYLRGKCLGLGKLGEDQSAVLARVASGELTLDEANHLAEEVKASFRRAAELEPENAMYQVMVAAVQAQDAKKSPVLPRDTAPSSKPSGFLSRLTGGKGSAADLVAAGNALANDGRFDEAVREFDKAIRADKKCAEAWFGKGIALTKSLGEDQQKIFERIARGELTLEDYQRIGTEAKQCLLKAAELAPDNVTYRLCAQQLK